MKKNHQKRGEGYHTIMAPYIGEFYRRRSSSYLTLYSRFGYAGKIYAKIRRTFIKSKLKPRLTTNANN